MWWLVGLAVWMIIAIAVFHTEEKKAMNTLGYKRPKLFPVIVFPYAIVLAFTFWLFLMFRRGGL